MLRLDITLRALVGLASGCLVSCATPKASVVEGAPTAQVEKKQEKLPEPVVPVPEPPLVDLPEDPIRMPNFLDLPSEGEFRATNPGPGKSFSSSGAVVSRPPTDPPSRVKPKPAEKE